MNYVTFETARRLKEAGFPQPTPEKHQFWYDKDTRPKYLFPFGCERDMYGNEIFSPHIFAPTATDILKELPSFSPMLRFENGRFEMVEFDKIEDMEVAVFWDERPAEAAATAWIMLNESKI